MTTLIISTDAPAVAGPPQGHWTYADWEMLPDDGNRYEIIDGVLYMTSAPSTFHQWIVKRLERYIGIPLEDQALGVGFPAPTGVLMPGCDPVQPDYVVILNDSMDILHDRRVMGVPDLIFEVQSPSNAAYDERVKLFAYAQAGVPEYMIINPRTRSLRHYRLDILGRYTTVREYSEADTIYFDRLPTIALPIAQLFAGAPDTML
jgi:Uma2 family endonuclease